MAPIYRNSCGEVRVVRCGVVRGSSHEEGRGRSAAKDDLPTLACERASERAGFMKRRSVGKLFLATYCCLLLMPGPRTVEVEFRSRRKPLERTDARGSRESPS